MRNASFLLVASLLVALATSLIPGSTQAQPLPAPPIQSGSDLLAAVNSLRLSQGLPAYAANPILMQIAQAHADYMAATGGAYGHTGPGGTRPIDRAVAAGYPAQFFSENWQAGSGLSPSGAVTAWQGDAPHLNTMLSGSLVDAGAGVSKSGGTIYYVLDAGGQGASSPGTGSAGTSIPAGTVQPSQFMVPVTLSTPGPDGLIYHEVAYGQSLWSIAIAYGTKIDAIQTLNNLQGMDIYPGQKLLILRGPTPAPLTPTALVTQTEAAITPTTAAYITPAPSSQYVAVTSIASPVVTPSVQAAKKGNLNLTAIAIIGGALLFAALGTWAGTRKPS
jgi:uncharacterized protein YkwD/LysM repeat protein